MDGTLVDSLMIWEVLWSSMGEKYLGKRDFSPSKEDDKRVRTLTLKAAMQLIHENYGIAENGEELLNFANDVMLNFYKFDAKLKSGVLEFLDYLQKNNVKMCIASATARELIEVALEQLDIKKYFSALFSCAESGRGKEHPDVFLEALSFLGASPSETWLFEDSLTAILTAKELGIQTVGIFDKFNYGQERIKETATVYIDEGETLLKLIKQHF